MSFKSLLKVQVPALAHPAHRAILHSHLQALHLRRVHFLQVALHLRAILHSHLRARRPQKAQSLSQIHLPALHLRAQVQALVIRHSQAHHRRLVHPHSLAVHHRALLSAHLALQALAIRPLVHRALHPVRVLLVVQAASAHLQVAHRRRRSHLRAVVLHPAQAVILLSHLHVRVRAAVSHLAVHLHSQALVHRSHFHPVALQIRVHRVPVIRHLARRVLHAQAHCQAAQALSAQALSAQAVHLSPAHPLRSARRVLVLRVHSALVVLRSHRAHLVRALLVLAAALSHQAQVHRARVPAAASRRRARLSQAARRVQVLLAVHRRLVAAHRRSQAHRRRAVFHHQAALSHLHLRSVQVALVAHLSHLHHRAFLAVQARAQALSHLPVAASAAPALRSAHHRLVHLPSQVHHSQARRSQVHRPASHRRVAVLHHLVHRALDLLIMAGSRISMIIIGRTSYI